MVSPISSLGIGLSKLRSVYLGMREVNELKGKYRSYLGEEYYKEIVDNPSILESYLHPEQMYDKIRDDLKENRKIILCPHFYGYYYMLGYPIEDKESYSLTKESNLMVLATSKLIYSLINSNEYLENMKNYNIVLQLNEGNTVFIDGAVNGVEIIYDELRNQLYGLVSKGKTHFPIMKLWLNGENIDTIGESKYTIRRINEENIREVSIFSLGFRNHLSAIERAWYYSISYYGLSSSFENKNLEVYVTDINSLFLALGEEELYHACDTETMEGRRKTEYLDAKYPYIRIILHEFPLLQKYMKKRSKEYKYTIEEE